MNSKITVLLFALLPLIAVNSQKPIVLSEDSIQIGRSYLPSLSVTIPEADFDVVLKDWIKEIESGTRSKVVNENGEMSLFGARIRKIDAGDINVYSKLVRLDSMLQLFASFEVKKDEYIESATGSPAFVSAQEFMKEFAKNKYIDVAKSQADAEEKKLKDLQRELSSLESEKSRMQKNIQSNNSRISTENENIILMNNELNTVTAALAEQNSLLLTMEEGPAKDELEKQIKELEKRKKRAERNVKKAERKIGKADTSIDQATGDIPRNERMQEKVKEQIAAQEAVYQKYAEKLNKIRAY
ncbi:MAG: hypothetical protein JXR67_08880 [Bacteroidales bacterium]|nr:hypothetical protein [Bacteroidales bacterium]